MLTVRKVERQTMNYKALLDEWNNIPSIKDYTNQELEERIAYISQKKDELPLCEWENLWQVEYDIAIKEREKRKKDNNTK